MTYYCGCANGVCRLHARQPINLVVTHRLYRVCGDAKILVTSGTLRECLQRAESEQGGVFELTLLKEYPVLMRGQVRED